MRALPIAPRLSGGVAHAIAAGVGVTVREGAVGICARGGCPVDVGLIVTHFVRIIRLRSCRKSESRKGARRAPDCATECGVCGGAIVVRFGARYVATSTTAMEAPTITHSILDLCSAPCKARRFAPPARARGLRALTMPARRSVLAIT